jgi:hypothetical protein
MDVCLSACTAQSGLGSDWRTRKRVGRFLFLVRSTLLCFNSILFNKYSKMVTGVVQDSIFWFSFLCFLLTKLINCYSYGRAIAQAVSRRFPTAAARVRAQVRSCGICSEKSGTGAILLRILRFPLPVLIPPSAPHSSSITRGWYNRPNSGRRTKWTQSNVILWY